MPAPSPPLPEPTESPPSAIVLGCDCVTGLQIARELHSHGIRVTGVARDPKHFTAYSRCYSEIIEAKPDSADLLARLIALSTPERAVLIPATDVAVDFLARHADALAPFFRNAISNPSAIQKILGKAAFSAHAEEHGFPLPRTRKVSSLDDIRAAARHLEPPFVLKPDYKTEAWEEAARAKLLVARTAEGLEEDYLRFRSVSADFVVQEWVEGGDDAMYSYYAFIGNDGRIVADCLAHKLRQWPRLVGSGTLAEVSQDAEIIGIGRRFFESTGHRGFAGLQVKRDSKTRALALIEANVGRPCMGSFLAEAVGIEMAYLAYREIAGLPASPKPEASHPGARWISWKRDQMAAMAAFRAAELTPGQYLRSLRGVRRAAVWSLRDPLPFVLDLLRTPAKLLARRRRRVEASARS